MSIYRLVVDQDRCIACHACEASCKAAHDSAPGISSERCLSMAPALKTPRKKQPIIVKHARPEAPAPLAADGERVVLHTRYRACVQCPQPRCVEVCPKEALIRRESDGIVFIREEACVGCGACQKACPHHLIWVDPRKRKSVKCDQCKDRLDAGLDTACVTVCPTGALKLVRKERPGR
ncbi:MAG: 4Fe-4S dicluster domain-containing protein [Bilophila wadsworthia]